MTIQIPSRAVAAFLAGVLSLGFLMAAHEPANKTSIAGAESEAVFVEGGASAMVLHETLKVSGPADLILSFTAECSILSRIKTVGNDQVETTGQLKVHLTVDGQHVPVSDEDVDEGRVVFCDRTYGRTTSLFDDEDATIEDFLATRTSNAFNWVALDAGRLDADGDGLLTVEAHVEYVESNVGDGDSQGVVGNRSLLVQPVMAKNDETRGA